MMRLLILLLVCPLTVQAAEINAGLVFFDGVEITTAAVSDIPTSPTSPGLKFKTGSGEILDVILVDFDDLQASNMRIRTQDGIKAIKRYGVNGTFVSIWKTTEDGESIYIPLPATNAAGKPFVYNINIDWGDEQRA